MANTIIPQFKAYLNAAPNPIPINYKANLLGLVRGLTQVRFNRLYLINRQWRLQMDKPIAGIRYILVSKLPKVAQVDLYQHILSDIPPRGV